MLHGIFILVVKIKVLLNQFVQQLDDEENWVGPERLAVKNH